MNEPAPTAVAIRRGPLRVSVTVFDHRGKAWRLARTPWKEARTRKWRREDFPETKDMVRFMLVNAVTALLLEGGILGLFYGLPMMLRSPKISPIVFVGLMAPLVVGVVQTFVIYKAARWLWAPIEAREMLRKNICPHCRFSIAAIVPDPDGCTVCPECGAAWKLPPPPPNNPA